MGTRRGFSLLFFLLSRVFTMADHRTHGRHNTHDTGAPETRARDDLRTANKKQKPNEARSEKRDNKDHEQQSTAGK
jgi:hypothetical protein